ncbi:complement C1q-like protein 2 [Anguilla anguilla]|uniref:complement C1q-like protein 2 n=1 Tax=Anguilla anguilla TaxID=7936 RepID=UPI0015AD2876|nr:complement C1q-like protein 2 [Anguilla anguilla]
MNNGTVVWRCINTGTYSRRAVNPDRMRSAIVLVGLLAGLACGRCNGEERERGVTEDHLGSQPNLSSELCSLKARVERLENDLKALPKVAFSVALRESGAITLGPFQTDTVIQYAKVFANIGNYYNPSTGIFTARVKGVYFFTFTAYNNVEMTPNTNVVLMKNGERTVSIWDKSGQDANDNASNAVVLQLEVGDSVFVHLKANTRVYDDMGHYNSFSGFLLFVV